MTADGDIEVMAPLAPRGAVFAARVMREQGRTLRTYEVIEDKTRSGSHVRNVTSNVYLCDTAVVCTT